MTYQALTTWSHSTLDPTMYWFIRRWAEALIWTLQDSFHLGDRFLVYSKHALFSRLKSRWQYGRLNSKEFLALKFENEIYETF